MQNTLENLELKLIQLKKEKAEEIEKVEKNFIKNYKEVLDFVFGADFLGVKKYISAYFQIEKIDFKEKSDNEILKNACLKSVEVFPISTEKKELFSSKILNFLENKEFVKEKIIKDSNILKNPNYPLIENLVDSGILNKEELLNLSLFYKEKKDFLESISVLNTEKKEIIKSHYFELNNTKSEERIINFKNDFKEEIENSKLITIYPRVLKFIGKNYTKLRLKNKTETKKQRLRRMFKIAFLKLYRLKYSGIDITNILNKIDSLDNLDELLSLLIKFFERLKQNPQLSQDYVVLDEVDEISEIKTEAEENKEKILFTEDKIIKASSLVEETENKLEKEDLEKILSEETDLVGDEFIFRKKEENAGILAENKDLEKQEDEEEEFLKEEDLNLLFEECKQKLFELEEKKKKLFLEGKYDEIDELNLELLELIKKLEKLKKILNIEED